jgi:hypothetical protein
MAQRLGEQEKEHGKEYRRERGVKVLGKGQGKESEQGKGKGPTSQYINMT